MIRRFVFPLLLICAALPALAGETGTFTFAQGIRDLLMSTPLDDFFATVGWRPVLMLAIGFLMLYLGVAKNIEPLLMLPIGFGTIFVNTVGAGMAAGDGFIGILFNTLVHTDLLPIFVFMGIGAMSDFSPLIANPRLFFIGAAAQLGVFGTLFAVVGVSEWMGYELNIREAASIAIIGAADGPTAILFSRRYAPDLMGAIAVAAYSYMALVPIIQPPVMRLLTTQRERRIHMPPLRSVKRVELLLFPVAVTAICAFFLPLAMPLIGSLMFGNFIRECGVAERISKALQNEVSNVATILLGLGVALKMEASVFLTQLTLAIFALGLLAFVFGTVGGILAAKVMNWFSPHSPVNPLIGSAGVSAFPMAARVSHHMGQEADPNNYLIFHAIATNLAGQIGAVVAAGALFALLG